MKTMLGVLAIGLGASVMGCVGAEIDPLDEESQAASTTWRKEAELATQEQRKGVVDEFVRRCRMESFTASTRHAGQPYTVRYHSCPAVGAQKGTFVVVPGTTESSIRYAEFASDWTRKGYTLFILNNRGEGFNARLLSDDRATTADESQRRHMVDFHHYVADLNDFVARVVVPRTEDTAHLMLVCHSMGGGICTRYAEVVPDNPFKGIMLSAPMQGIQTKFYERWLAGIRSLTRPEQWVPGGGPYDPAEPFANNVLTGSANRFAMRHYINQRFPEVQLGSPTYAWAARAIGATETIQKDAAKIKRPMIIFSALSDDIVDPASHKKVCDSINAAGKTRCTLKPLTGAEHEVFIERDAIRNGAFQDMTKFIAEVAP